MKYKMIDVSGIQINEVESEFHNRLVAQLFFERAFVESTDFKNLPFHIDINGLWFADNCELEDTEFELDMLDDVLIDELEFGYGEQ